jgi:hypothetical protein
MRDMTTNTTIEAIQAELQEGMAPAKCQTCGCMQETLTVLQSAFSTAESARGATLPDAIDHWLPQMEPIKYRRLAVRTAIRPWP